jgi:hypothetical protein
VSGTLVPRARLSNEATAERRTISGEQCITLPRSDTLPVSASAEPDDAQLHGLFDGTDVDVLIEGALDETRPGGDGPTNDVDAAPARREHDSGHPHDDHLVPITTGTVQLPRFRSSNRPPTPVTAAAVEPARAQSSAPAPSPPWLEPILHALSSGRRSETAAAARLFVVLVAVTAALVDIVSLVLF